MTRLLLMPSKQGTTASANYRIGRSKGSLDMVALAAQTNIVSKLSQKATDDEYNMLQGLLEFLEEVLRDNGLPVE